MNKNVKYGLIIAGVAVVAYFAYQWYQNRQSSTGYNSGLFSGALGTNLNSTNPGTTAYVSPDQSGLNYNGGSVTIDVTNPVPQQPPPHLNPPPPVPKPKPPKHVRGEVTGIPQRLSHFTPSSPMATNAESSRVVHPKLNKTPHSISNAVVRRPTTAKPAKKA
jgi:hypothetical protein